MQANLAIVPHIFADHLEAFAAANANAFPLLARGRAGDPSLPSLGKDLDLRFDLPRYRVMRPGVAAEDRLDIADLWRTDLTPFAIGCSLSFESDLISGGVNLRCYGEGRSCSAFHSDLPLAQVGPFGGTLVVSMRAVPEHQVGRAIEITAAHPHSHGAPVHVGDPSKIGVDLTSPIDGIGLTDIKPGEVPIFWACGVSLESAIARAKPDLAITHAPGHMLICDLPAAALRTHKILNDNKIQKGETYALSET